MIAFRVNLYVAMEELTVMRMVPKRSCLIWNFELIQKGIFRHDWALVDTVRTVRPGTPLLEQAMPMLVDHRCDLIRTIIGLKSLLTTLVVVSIDVSFS